MSHPETNDRSHGHVSETPPKPAAERNGSSDQSAALLHDLDALFDGEKELVRELIKGLREIRYGSIVLTVHDSRVVEINKSVRIRKSRPEKET